MSETPVTIPHLCSLHRPMERELDADQQRRPFNPRLDSAAGTSAAGRRLESFCRLLRRRALCRLRHGLDIACVLSVGPGHGVS